MHIQIKINGQEVTLNKNEAKEVSRIAHELFDKEYAQRTADIWMRSAPTKEAQERRKVAVRALGLSDVIQYL